MFNRILQKTVELGLIALVIIFQPELRRLLERMGSKALPRFGAKPLETLGMDNVISQTIAAARSCRRPRPARSSFLSAA